MWRCRTKEYYRPKFQRVTKNFQNFFKNPLKDSEKLPIFASEKFHLLLMQVPNSQTKIMFHIKRKEHDEFREQSPGND